MTLALLMWLDMPSPAMHHPSAIYSDHHTLRLISATSVEELGVEELRDIISDIEMAIPSVH